MPYYDLNVDNLLYNGINEKRLDSYLKQIQNLRNCYSLENT